MGSAERTKRKQRSPRPPLDAHERAVDPELTTAELRVSRFQLAGEDYAVLSYPHPGGAAAALLTEAEKAIFSALLSGQTNQQIADSRGRALRTVANQVAAVFQKLGVGSRAELVTKFSRPR